MTAMISAETPFVSIIMLNYNGRKFLGKLLDECLLSVLNMDYANFEVLFADNGSTDNSVPHIMDRFSSNKKLRVVSLDKNYGFAKGNNMAVKYVNSKSEYLVFLNTDVTVNSAWLRNMINFIKKVNESGLQKVAAISSVILDVSRKKIIDELWIGYPSGAYYVPLKSKSSFKSAIELDFPAGEAFLIKRDAFTKIGGFDEDFFLYIDDSDLGWRLRLAGYKILLNPSAKISHFRSLTTRKTVDRRRVFYLVEQNRLISCIKNLGKFSLVALVLYEMRRFMVILKSKDLFIEYMKALLSIRTNLKGTLVKRRQIQLMRQASDRKIFELSIRRMPRNINRFARVLYECFT